MRSKPGEVESDSSGNKLYGLGGVYKGSSSPGGLREVREAVEGKR